MRMGGNVVGGGAVTGVVSGARHGAPIRFVRT